MKYPEDIINKVHCADCLEFMKEMPDNCIDLIVTDPPFGISFMGKEWDKALPSIEIWKECLRVLKDGAFAFVMSIPRQDCLSRMIIRLEDAGFNVRFTPMYHAFASGFPKAQNVGKVIDKRLGAKRKKYLKSIAYPDSNCWGTPNKNIGCENNYLGHGIVKLGGVREQSLPASPQAKALDGSYSGFQPKPSVEVIIVAMKPLSKDCKTYVDQALKNKHGCTWLDDCRIPYESTQNPATNPLYRKEGGYKLPERGKKSEGAVPFTSSKNEVEPKGRFPANLLVSSDVLNDGKVISYGKREKPYSYQNKKYQVEGFIKDNSPQSPSNYADTGSFSRYFDLDKWAQKTFPFLIVPKASKCEKNKGLGDFPEQKKWLVGGGGTGISARESIIARNYHPTCKPLKLMSYLITLGSRQGDVVLDCFAGSGSTLVACKQLNRKFIGIEISPEYCAIAEKRIKATHRQERLF